MLLSRNLTGDLKGPGERSGNRQRAVSPGEESVIAALAVTQTSALKIEGDAGQKDEIRI